MADTETAPKKEEENDNSANKNDEIGDEAEKKAAKSEMRLWFAVAFTFCIYSITNSFLYGRIYNDIGLLALLLQTAIVASIIVAVPVMARQIFGKYPLMAFRSLMRSDDYRLKLETELAKHRLAQISGSSPALEEIKFENPRVLLKQYAAASSIVAQQMYTRAGAYLMSGAIIAFLGLGVFIFIRNGSTPAGIDVWERLINLVPSFGVLFFIEFVALFFLRQYRSAMDDFRYYDSVRRHRQDSLVALSMFAENETIVPTSEVIRAISIYSTAGKLMKDETTEILETRKLQRDEIVLIEKLFEAMATIRENSQSVAKGKP